MTQEEIKKEFAEVTGINEEGKHLSWEAHLRAVCQRNGDMDNFDERKKYFRSRWKGEFAYPKLLDNKKYFIRVIAESLYNNIMAETENSLSLYAKIIKAFVNKGS